MTKANLTLMTIKIIDEPYKFEVQIFVGTKLIHTCGWKGSAFKYNNELYTVMGPYHSLEGDQFRVYRLEPVSELA